MDRFDVIKFEDLSGPKGGEWLRIGGGSFGVVFRGEYLGTEVAIKEVLPNNTYDVEKYFERECVLMKEARHPNIVQYIGLTKSPGRDGRIYIVSEFVGPNLRQHIADKSKPFDWPLRMSFATDIARAVAYLHARNCLHRDLKGENLLITDNHRVKVCDFGFARIAARNEEEMRRISYCGTDGYMSPEILMGIDFSLPSDVFSLGVIFCEIISRHLVDPNTFKRQMPTFGLDEDEVKEMASNGCPKDFIQLCLDMVRVEPTERPDMRHVIRRLRLIEQEVVQREHAKGTLSNVGSLRGSSLAAVLGSKKNNNKRPGSRRLPSFEGHINAHDVASIKEEPHGRSSSESSDEDVEEALRALEQLNVGQKGGSRVVANSIRMASTYKAAGHGNPWWDDNSDDSIPSLPVSWLQNIPSKGSQSSTWKRNVKPEEQYEGQQDSTIRKTATPKTKKQQEEEYSTSVVRPSRQVVHPSLASSLSKMTGAGTIKAGQESGPVSASGVRQRTPLEQVSTNGRREVSEAETLKASVVHTHVRDESADDTRQSFMTARIEDSVEHNHPHTHEHRRGGDPSLAMATIASSFFDASLMYHRFTLVKNGTRRPGETSAGAAATASMVSYKMPYQLILANALTKCNVCSKRLGFGAYMDCDDCPYKTHVGCAAMAEPNCQELHIPHGSHSPSSDSAGPSSPRTMSPKSPPSRSGSYDEESDQLSPELIARVPSPPVRVNTPKSQPSSLSKGVAIFRKRNSKSPPPKNVNQASVVRV